jgi:hypothetical protein
MYITLYHFHIHGSKSYLNTRPDQKVLKQPVRNMILNLQGREVNSIPFHSEWIENFHIQVSELPIALSSAVSKGSNSLPFKVT